MRARGLFTIVVAAVLIYAAVRMLGGSGPPPPVFAAMAYEEARSLAERDGKVLVADYTAGWCPPCRKMDRTTWRDAAVGEWIGKHAVAVQVDVDRRPDLARLAGASSIPLIVVTRDGREVARWTGYQDAPTLLAALARTTSVADGPGD